MLLEAPSMRISTRKTPLVMVPLLQRRRLHIELISAKARLLGQRSARSMLFNIILAPKWI